MTNTTAENDFVPQNEFSIKVDLQSLPPGGKIFRMVLGPEAYIPVAKRLHVVAIKSCVGEIELTLNKSTIKAKGFVRAELIRECVASLEEMDEAINDNFEIEFLRDGAARGEGGDIEEENLPEFHHGDMFDVGELLIQQVSLAMAPFPRKGGAVSLTDEYGVEAELSPFAVLQQNLGKDEKNH